MCERCNLIGIYNWSLYFCKHLYQYLMKISVSPLNIDVRGQKFSYVVQQIIAENGDSIITVTSSEDELQSDRFHAKITLKYNADAKTWEPENNCTSLIPEVLEALQSRFLKLKNE